jgi:hypothetical protein
VIALAWLVTSTTGRLSVSMAARTNTRRDGSAVPKVDVFTLNTALTIVLCTWKAVVSLKGPTKVKLAGLLLAKLPLTPYDCKQGSEQQQKCRQGVTPCLGTMPWPDGV